MAEAENAILTLNNFYMKYGFPRPTTEFQNNMSSTFTATTTFMNLKSTGIASTKAEAKRLSMEAIVTQLSELESKTGAALYGEGSEQALEILSKFCNKKKIPHPRYEVEIITEEHNGKPIKNFQAACHIGNKSFIVFKESREKALWSVAQVALRTVATQLKYFPDDTFFEEKEKFNDDSMAADRHKANKDMEQERNIDTKLTEPNSSAKKDSALFQGELKEVTEHDSKLPVPTKSGKVQVECKISPSQGSNLLEGRTLVRDIALMMVKFQVSNNNNNNLTLQNKAAAQDAIEMQERQANNQSEPLDAKKALKHQIMNESVSQDGNKDVQDADPKCQMNNLPKSQDDH